MNLHPFIILITGLLIVLWTYAVFIKLSDLKKFHHALMAQVFPRAVGRILLYTLPLFELTLAILLIAPQTRLTGMYASMFSMLLFTLYVGGAVFHVYPRYPCACGGIFGRLSWHIHLRLNIMLTLITVIGVILMEF